MEIRLTRLFLALSVAFATFNSSQSEILGKFIKFLFYLGLSLLISFLFIHHMQRSLNFGLKSKVTWLKWPGLMAPILLKLWPQLLMVRFAESGKPTGKWIFLAGREFRCWGHVVRHIRNNHAWVWLQFLSCILTQLVYWGWISILSYYASNIFLNALSN